MNHAWFPAKAFHGLVFVFIMYYLVVSLVVSELSHLLHHRPTTSTTTFLPY